ncbi:MAG TPA: hypothetical protein VHF05_01085 [Candidatus Paceibacterota bacterium]|jgi:hypothetical protein|nr:hypothetical protein [Candidatus Paceibacterota bacterium]
MKKTFIITAAVILAIFIIALAIWLPNRNDSSAADRTEQSTAPATPPVATYGNTAYGYELDFPPELETRMYSQDDVVFGHKEGDGIDGVAEARVLKTGDAEGGELENAVIGEMANLCAADGPNESLSCSGADQAGAQAFISDSGLRGFIFYLSGEIKNTSAGSSTPIEKGPYVAFPLTDGATLVIHPPLNKNAKETDASVITQVAKSVRIKDAAISSPSGE